MPDISLCSDAYDCIYKECQRHPEQYKPISKWQNYSSFIGTDECQYKSKGEGLMEKIKVWNWQRIHGQNASSEGWMYNLLMQKQITVIENHAVKILEGVNAGTVAEIGDFIVYFCPPRHEHFEVRAVSKDDFDANYETMSGNYKKE